MKSKPFKVYASEKADGLEELIRANTSFAYTSLVELTDILDVSKFEKTIKAQAGEGVGNDYSLHYLKSIMVSTGANKNDDIFLPDELWKARHTPEDKPFDYEHDVDDIIGHITGNYCIDAEGSVIDDETKIDEIPETFHIVASAVLYKQWKSEEKQERMDTILKEIGKGERSVSMECVLTNFDYMLIENEGTEKAIASIVPRTDKTSYLTKHLRIYKGKGSYEGKKIKRVLRNITFSGKGLVKKPANPSSVILTDIEDVVASNQMVYISTNENKESLMATENTFEKENTELKVKVEKLEASARERDEKALKAQADTFQAEAKTLRDENTALKSELAVASKNLTEVSTAKASYEVTIAKYETEKKTASRITAVATTLSLEPAKAEKIVATTMKFDDTEFDAFLKAQADYEAEKAKAYTDAMSKGGSSATEGGDPMSKGGAPLKGAKPTEPTPLVVMNTPGASKKFAGEVVNLAKGTKPVNLPAGVTASETVDPAEDNAVVTKVDEVEAVVTPTLAGATASVDEKVENRRKAIATYMNKSKKKESK